MRRHDGRTRRCSHRLIRQRRLTLELLERRDLLATVSWDGGGDNSSWGDRFNWGGDQLPGTLDDVVIADSNLTVTHRTASTTVRSITSQAAINLTSGSLKVTAGVSMLHGALTAETGTALRAEGADVSLVVLGATDVNGASLFALNGGEICGGGSW